jgi:hypothetical protein
MHRLPRQDRPAPARRRTIRRSSNRATFALAENGFMRALLLVLVVLVATTPVLADIDWFTTPSGNIHCTIGIGEGPSDIECTIYERSGRPATRRLAKCDDAKGHKFFMRGRGAVTAECGRSGEHPDSPSPGNNALRYGDTMDFSGDIVCRSSESELRCRNASGHGFPLSRRSQSVF